MRYVIWKLTTRIQVQCDSRIGREALTEVTELFAGAYIEPIADGVYVSCWEFLNPRGKELTAGLEAKKVSVARYIAAIR